MSESPKFQVETAAFDRFLKEWREGGFKGLRLGQAFYNYFFLHKLSDQKGLGKLYEATEEEALKLIHELFSFH